MVDLGKHQLDAIEKLGNGKILCGGTGSGKSRAAIAYFYLSVCEGTLKINGKGESGYPQKPRDLYIITTAKKRDGHDWEDECSGFNLSAWDPADSVSGIRVTVDSWNNIQKYKNTVGAFFIFDEQRLVGTGKWVKTFLHIARRNRWILLSATPGDTWLDFAPVFIANGFYRNITDFKRQHVVYSNHTKFPKVDHYVEQNILLRHRSRLLVDMPLLRHTTRHLLNVPVAYNELWEARVRKDRWNVYENRPIKDISEMFRCLRHVVNEDPSRTGAVAELLKKHSRLIVFYNFNYELEKLRSLSDYLGVERGEWNGHRHDPLPDGDGPWLYLVQYTAGAEGWNCVTTDAMVFYSLNYSYKIMEQARGRIDRMNTTYTDLYYYTLRSTAPIDLAILKSLRAKKTFNERSAKL